MCRRLTRNHSAPASAPLLPSAIPACRRYVTGADASDPSKERGLSPLPQLPPPRQHTLNEVCPRCRSCRRSGSTLLARRSAPGHSCSPTPDRGCWHVGASLVSWRITRLRPTSRWQTEIFTTGLCGCASRRADRKQAHCAAARSRQEWRAAAAQRIFAAFLRAARQ